MGSAYRRIVLLVGATLAAFAAAGVACAADFQIKQSDLTDPVSVIAYGDTRFTDPHNNDASNPKVRKWLVDRITAEHPAALLISGDIPWHGAEKGDYAVFAAETVGWRATQLRVYPALGNHELNGPDQEDCLKNWKHAFPDLHGKRWYSVQVGDSIYVLNLDSNSSLLIGSAQEEWIRHELRGLPATVRFLFVNLHHPPVSDLQKFGDDEHNVRPNEASLAGLLKEFALGSPVQVVVAAGHVHNYERFMRDGIVYLVSGGGGAKPRAVVRANDDQFKSAAFPNYHYVKFTFEGGVLNGAMIRVADPDAISPHWELADHFTASRPLPTPQAAATAAK